MSTDSKVDQVIKLLQGEIERNDHRFFEVKDSIKDLKQDVSGLKQEINKVYTSLSEDIQVFGEEQEKLKRRVDNIERKIA